MQAFGRNENPAKGGIQVSGLRRDVAASSAQAGFSIWDLLTPDT